MTHPTNPSALKVKRDGPRGWHWIAAENFNPDIHMLADAPEGEPRKPGRPRKAKEGDA